jgi:tryptophan 2,3-dioxygenase
MSVDRQTATGYAPYLRLEELLAVQRPVTDRHDETLFIIVHQVHELWFKLLLHEFAELQRRLVSGRTGPALESLNRILLIIRVVIHQLDVLETMTPQQFEGFRGMLGTSSGAQSAQFREIEAVLGHRAERLLHRHPVGSVEHSRILAAMTRPSLFDSFLEYVSVLGYPVPADLLYRDVSTPYQPSPEVQEVLAQAWADDSPVVQVGERLLDLDRAMQDWRYHHIAIVERIIGNKRGTGGSTGAAYLRATLREPMFPDLWRVRHG